MASLAVKGAAKGFGKTPALKGLTFTVPDGEFCVLAGPPGAGKTTVLRAIVGLDHLDSGSIEIEGEAVGDLRPHQRDVAMVFQQDTLFRTKSVYKNIAFSLKARRVRRREIADRVRGIAGLLGLADRLKSRVDGLAEIDRRRVAIARAVVREAGICLLDEPFADLPPETRDLLREEIRLLHREFPTTMLYVTRHASDAMAFGERTLAMHAGRIEQGGSPLNLYELPQTRFVGSYFGWPKMNFLAGALSRGEGGDAIRLGVDGPVAKLPPNRLPAEAVDGQPVLLGVRPEHMIRAVRASPGDGAFRFDAEVEALRPAGSRVYATFRLAGSPVLAELMVHDVTRVGAARPD